jgi:dethiobiotin synthase
VRPLYIVGTMQNVGKTTFSIGLCHALRNRGLRVGYMKPLGQRMDPVEGATLHQDSQLVAGLLGHGHVEQADMAIPLPPGRVQEEIANPRPAELMAKVVEAYESVARAHDVVIVEGMGHVAMGACLGVSCADACRALNAKALLVSGGGVGRAIDHICLCSSFIQCRGAELAGVVVNKIWPEKYARIREATTRGLANMGIRSFGMVPYEQRLDSPTMREVHEHIGGTLLAGQEGLSRRVYHTIVAAMEANHVIRYIKGNSLIITPGDRSDNILAALRAHMLGGKDRPSVSGLILTGDFHPEERVLEGIRKFELPVILVQQDTFSVASKIINTVFKIRPGDRERIDWAVCLIKEYVDVDGIIEAIGC